MRPVIVTSLAILLVASACASSQPTDTKRERLTEPADESPDGGEASSDEPESDEAEETAGEVELALLQSAAKDSKRVARGKETYVARCSTCHGRQVQGLIGPNLTDEYWLHGGDLRSIYETIYNGVPDKGCPKWSAKGLLERDEIVDLVAFIDSIRGSNPDRPKSPEGERYQAD